jgi:hypothetical protein
VQPSAGTNAVQSLCGYIEKPLPKYPKNFKIRHYEYIAIHLETPNGNSFNCLSNRSGELIQGFRTVQRVLSSLWLCSSARYGYAFFVSQGFVITHNDAPHAVGLHWMSDQSDAPDNTQHTQQTNIIATGGIFFYCPRFVRFVYFCSSVPFVSDCTACCGFFHYEKSDGFCRERTRDLGFQRPARKPLDHRSR